MALVSVPRSVEALPICSALPVEHACPEIDNLVKRLHAVDGEDSVILKIFNDFQNRIGGITCDRYLACEEWKNYRLVEGAECRGSTGYIDRIRASDFPGKFAWGLVHGKPFIAVKQSCENGKERPFAIFQRPDNFREIVTAGNQESCENGIPNVVQGLLDMESYEKILASLEASGDVVENRPPLPKPEKVAIEVDPPQNSFWDTIRSFFRL